MTKKTTCGYIVYTDYKIDPGDVYYLWEDRDDAISHAMMAIDSIAEDQRRVWGFDIFDGDYGQSREGVEKDLRDTGETILLGTESEASDNTLIRIVETVKYVK